jgi:DNA-binding PadR family transcriptional regulator
MNSTGVLILTRLADGDKHGYALTKDVAAFAGVKLAPGTLYEALQRLERQGLIEPLEPVERPRPYRLTAAGASALGLVLIGPHGLHAPGVIDLMLVAANAGALGATATARFA